MLHCPVCRSTKIYVATGGYGGYIYRCKECGYRGPLVIEYNDEPEDEKRSDS